VAIIGTERGRHLYDISFIVSFRCDLACTFCMYSSGPDVAGELDPALAQRFIDTIDLDCVNAFGLYGGEPALFIPQNTAILRMLPEKPRFVISNGTWSQSVERTQEFMDWADEWGLRVFVSSTAQHRRAQDRAVLLALVAAGRIVLKPAEPSFIPMGRLARPDAQCTRLCDHDDKPTRIALQPDGTVMFQNCDGDYPAIGTAAEGFPVVAARLKAQGWRSRCPLYREANATHFVDIVPAHQTR
jgi:hypothetical protein